MKSDEGLEANLEYHRNNREAPHWLYDNIAECSKNVRKQFFIINSFFAYCVITAVGTTQRQLILNEPVNLPLLNVNVPIQLFFILAPALSIFAFIYFQLNLFRLKGLIDDLQNNYAKVEKRRLYPWFFNYLFDPDEGFIGALQNIFIRLSIWWIMPHVLILCTYFYAYKHNPIFSYATAQFTVIGLIATIWFRFEFEPSVKAQGYIKNLNIYQIVIIVILALVFIYSFLVIFVNKSFTLDIHPLNDFNWLPQKEVIFILCINSFLLSAYLVVWCIIFLDRLNRFSTKFFDKLLTGELIVYQSQYLLYAFILLWFSYFNYEGTYFLFNVNIQNQILVTKPAVEHENVYWIDLKDAHLEAANLSGSVLNHADLRNAHFDWAKLNYTDLSNCNLEGVNFKEASLKGADLRGAKGLTAKQLSQAYTLQGVELDGGLRSYFKESSYYLLLNPGNPNFSIKRYPFYEPIGERKISFINDKP